MACDASFLKHYHTPVIHFGILHFKSEETLFCSVGPISRYSPSGVMRGMGCWSCILARALGVLSRF